MESLISQSVIPELVWVLQSNDPELLCGVMRTITQLVKSKGSIEPFISAGIMAPLLRLLTFDIDHVVPRVMEVIIVFLEAGGTACDSFVESSCWLTFINLLYRDDEDVLKVALSAMTAMVRNMTVEPENSAFVNGPPLRPLVRLMEDERVQKQAVEVIRIMVARMPSMLQMFRDEGVGRAVIKTKLLQDVFKTKLPEKEKNGDSSSSL